MASKSPGWASAIGWPGKILGGVDNCNYGVVKLTVCIPSAETCGRISCWSSETRNLLLTQVKPSHECQLAIYNEKLLVMCPIQDNVIGHTVDGANGIVSCFGQVKVSKIAKGLFKLRLDVIAGWNMIWMSKDVNIWMKGFKGMFCVL